MPIRPENAARYPKEWKTVVVPRIRARSGNRCECTGQCGQIHSHPAHGIGSRCQRINGEFGYHDKRSGHWTQLAKDESGLDMRAEVADLVDGENVVKIVLTVMHLNHDPADCRDENLLHGCQGCHNRYDAPVRAAGIKARRRAQRASGDLFQCEETA